MNKRKHAGIVGLRNIDGGDHHSGCTSGGGFVRYWNLCHKCGDLYGVRLQEIMLKVTRISIANKYCVTVGELYQ